MYQDIERISMEPTQEDREWFHNQEWVGNGDWLKNVKWAIENFKDESFIQQFLSPKVMRDFKMFNIRDDEDDPKLEVAGIHNEQGYKNVREALAKQYNLGYKIPDIQVFDVDKWGDRSMTLRHYMVDGIPLERESTIDTLRYVSYLWGYDVKLDSVDLNNNVRSSYQNANQDTALDIFLEDD
jgi:stage V sporulation protein R